MINKQFISVCQEAFNIDGTLRDIYIHNTSIDDWERMLYFLSSSTKYTINFYIDGLAQKLPKRASTIFRLVRTKTITLSIDTTELAINCHFFKKGEIELDVDPKNVQDEQRAYRLLVFIMTLGQLLSKKVDITEENLPDHPIFHFDPREGFKEF